MAAAQYYEQVQEAYLAYYGRPADPAGQAYWAQQLDAANGNLSSIINAFGTSTESTALYGGSSVQAQVNAIYEQLFGRQADLPGLTFYVNGINNGTFSLASVALNIYNGAMGSDATQLAAKLEYADAFTSAVSQSVSAELAYSGTAAGTNARAAVSGVTDEASEASAAANLSTTVANIGTGTVGTVYTLTTGVDNITLTGNNNVVNATDGGTNGNTQTWSALDTITGTGTGNTLNVATAQTQSSVPAGATVSGVQTFNFTESGNHAVTLDTATGFSGLTTFNVNAVGGSVTLISAATTNVTVTETPAATTTAAQVSVDGGDNVTVNTNGDVVIGGTTAPAGAITVNETGTGSVGVDGGTSVNVTAASTTNVNTIAIDANTATTGAVTVSATGAVIDGITIGSATVAPTGAITVTATTTAAATSVGNAGGVELVNTVGIINVNGGTTVSVTENIAAQNVLGSTGTTATSVGGAVNVNGSATTTSVTVNQSAAVAAVEGQAVVLSNAGTHATDDIIFGNVAAGATVTIGGTTINGGTNGVSAAEEAALYLAEATGSGLAAATSAIATTGGAGAVVTGPWVGGFTGASVSGNEILLTSATTGVGAPLTDSGNDGTTNITAVAGTPTVIGTPAVAAVGGVADGAVTITDVNYTAGKSVGAITSVSLNNFSGGATIYDSGLSNLTLAGTGAAVTINAGTFATPVTTLNLTADAVTGASAAVIDAGITTLNLVTGGAAASTLAFNDAALTTLNISGTENITLDASSTAITAVNVSGSAGVTLTLNNASEAFTSTGTGNDVLTLGAGVDDLSKAITFGSGDNSLLASNSGQYIASGVTVDGGASGANTISASLIANSVGATVENFQILDVSGYTGTIDTSLLATSISGVAISSNTGAVATLENLAAAVTVTDTFSGDDSTLVLTHAGTATDSVAVNFADSSAVAGVQTLFITSTGDSSVTVASGGAAGSTNNLNLFETDNHLSTLTIKGSAALNLNLVLDTTADFADTGVTAAVASALKTIDGSAATGALHITVGATEAAGTGGNSMGLDFTGVTIHGGTGGDTIVNATNNGVITEGATAADSSTVTAFNTLTASGNSASINDSASAANDHVTLLGNNDSATLGSGNDTVNLNGTSDSATLGSGKSVVANLSGLSDSVTLGSGTAVTVNVGDDTGAVGGDLHNVTFGSGVATVNDSLHFGSGVADYLTLGGTLSGNTLAFTGVTVANAAGALGVATALPSGAGAGTLTFAQIVGDAQSATAHTVTWFQFGGNTYVEESGSGSGSGTATAELVKIAGTVDLSHATVTAAGALHFA
ncbi:MAG: DUF4214 domain-containing protein [Paraburkholderia sp.]|uniref:beta strand repeat-containing protein n=1 Tax=Paraburkholderia sp. TaxID=1926495 RepID=UPI003C6634C6